MNRILVETKLGAPKMPKPPNIPLPPPGAHAPTLGSQSVALAGALEKQKASAAEGQGFNNTVLTSPQGTTTPATAKPALK